MHLPHQVVHMIDRVTQHIYRWSGGRIGQRQFGWTMLLLTTTGRRGGVQRTHTLVYLRHESMLLIVASNNGADRPPAWYLNLQANPQVWVQHGRTHGRFMARTATAEERVDLWPRLIAYHPPYAAHQLRTAREIPVVILTPIVD